MLDGLGLPCLIIRERGDFEHVMAAVAAKSRSCFRGGVADMQHRRKRSDQRLYFAQCVQTKA